MTESEYNLKPCPFCGNKAELIVAPGYFKSGLSSSGWLVKCTNGCCNQMPYMSDHDAVEAWNRRETAQSEAIPLEWINKHLEWLDNWGNDYSRMARASIRTMVESWKIDMNMT